MHEPLPDTQNSELVQRKTLDEWMAEQGTDLSSLLIARVPPPVLGANRICVAFYSPGMIATMKRFAGQRLAISVDVKQGTLEHGAGIATASFIAKDKLRNTHLCTLGKKRVQGRAYTSHAFPALQAELNTESTANFDQFFSTLARLWGFANPGSPSMAEAVVQVHKDYADAIEAPRLAHFPNSRPMNDYFHLTEKKKTIEAKCSVQHLSENRYVKTNYSWIMNALEDLRFLPTIDVYSTARTRRGGILGRERETNLHSMLDEDRTYVSVQH